MNNQSISHRATSLALLIEAAPWRGITDFQAGVQDSIAGYLPELSEAQQADVYSKIVEACEKFEKPGYTVVNKACHEALRGY